ncbi:Uncharacterised protein [Moraxella ovis]|nr:Uncharacterised protein [Moraxella ovis]
MQIRSICGRHADGRSKSDKNHKKVRECYLDGRGDDCGFIGLFMQNAKGSQAMKSIKNQHSTKGVFQCFLYKTL